MVCPAVTLTSSASRQRGFLPRYRSSFDASALSLRSDGMRIRATKRIHAARRAVLLRQALRQVRGQLRNGTAEPSAVARVREVWGNSNWTASVDFLLASIQACQQTQAAVVECGSGLSTAVIGLALEKSKRHLITLEHDNEWARRTRRRVRFAGITNVRVLDCPLESKGDWSWYAVSSRDLPRSIGVVICDGPPADTPGGRRGMLPALRGHLTHDPIIVLDDVDRTPELNVAEAWADELGLVLEISNPDVNGGQHALIRPPGVGA